MQQHFKTVLGNIPENELGITLSHEHICCYSETLYQMAGDEYLNKEKLLKVSVDYLKELKEKYGLCTFIDCTPINIGRDIELLKEVSKKSGVNIICSAGFYYTEEPILRRMHIDLLTDYIVSDARNVNAGIIKCAVEEPKITTFTETLLRACARAQLKLELPIVLHTNANNKNGLAALKILLSEGVAPQAITVGHLSDTENLEYIKQVAEYGCFIGLDRLYLDFRKEYIQRKIETVLSLFESGYGDRILLSHDDSFFNGFVSLPVINHSPRFSYCFENILPKLSKTLTDKVMIENTLKMLKCGEENGL